MSLGVISAHAVAGSPAAAVDAATLATAPTFYLPMTELSGSPAADTSGNAHDFTVANMGAYNQAGLYTGGKSFDFNGASSQLSTPSASWQNGGGGSPSFSIAAWIRPDANAFNAIAAKDVSGSGWAFYIGPTLNAFIPGGGNSHVGATPVTTGATHFAVFTYDHPTTAIKVYLDGALDGSFTQAVNNGAFVDFLIGVATGSNGGAARFFWFDGRMAGVGYWLRALSGAEISTIYAAR